MNSDTIKYIEKLKTSARSDYYARVNLYNHYRNNILIFKHKCGMFKIVLYNITKDKIVLIKSLETSAKDYHKTAFKDILATALDISRSNPDDEYFLMDEYTVVMTEYGGRCSYTAYFLKNGRITLDVSEWS